MEPMPMTEPTVTNISITVLTGNRSKGTFSVEVTGGTISDVKVNTMAALNNEPNPKNGEIPKTLTNTSRNTWTGVITYDSALVARASDAYSGKLLIAYTSPNPEPDDLESTYEHDYTTGLRA